MASISHNGQTVDISGYSPNTLLSQIVQHASAKWAGVESATLLANGIEVSTSTTKGQLPPDAVLTFRMPTGSKA